MWNEKFLAGKQLLIVEDVMLIALDLEGIVEDLGARCAGIAASVAQALEIIGEMPLDGVLLDINLAGESGYLIADELIRRNIPFVFMTGYDALPAEYAVFPFVTKPFDYAELRDVLRSVFWREELLQQTF